MRVPNSTRSGEPNAHGTPRDHIGPADPERAGDTHTTQQAEETPQRVQGRPSDRAQRGSYPEEWHRQQARTPRWGVPSMRHGALTCQPPSPRPSDRAQLMQPPPHATGTRGWNTRHQQHYQFATRIHSQHGSPLKPAGVLHISSCNGGLFTTQLQPLGPASVLLSPSVHLRDGPCSLSHVSGWPHVPLTHVLGWPPTSPQSRLRMAPRPPQSRLRTALHPLTHVPGRSLVPLTHVSGGAHVPLSHVSGWPRIPSVTSQHGPMSPSVTSRDSLASPQSCPGTPCVTCLFSLQH